MKGEKKVGSPYAPSKVPSLVEIGGEDLRLGNANSNYKEKIWVALLYSHHWKTSHCPSISQGFSINVMTGQI